MNPPSRKRILFIADAVTLAHVVRPLILARSLNPAEYEIHFACDPRGTKFLHESDFHNHTISSISSERFLQALAAGKPLYNYDDLCGYLEEDLALLHKIQPDFIVGDFRLSLTISAPISSVPYATLANAHWSPYATHQQLPLPDLPIARWFGITMGQMLFDLVNPIYSIFHCRPLNRLRRQHGLSPLKTLREVYTHGDYTLYADLPALVPTTNLPANHRYLGPINWSPTVETPDWWHEADDGDHSSIYVTLGSSGQIALLPKVVEALSDYPGKVFVATAGRIQLDHVPANTRVTDYLPGQEAAKRSRLVVCNGGSAPVYQALEQGTPVLGIASNLDQYLTMSAVQRVGAGVLIRSGKATTSALRNAIEEMIHTPAYRTTAQSLAKQIPDQYNAPKRFKEFLRTTLG